MRFLVRTAAVITVAASAQSAWGGGFYFDYSLGATLTYLGDGKVDQTAQDVRFKGEFDTNYALFVGGTLRYAF